MNAFSYKIFLFFVGITIFLPIRAQQQPKFSAYGDVHTPSGRLHILWVFVRFEDKDIFGRVPEWIDTTAEGFLPQMAMGGAVNPLLDATPETLTQPNHIQNISDYFYQNSNGKFIITGDIFPCQVPVKYIPESSGNFFSRQSQMNEAAIKWIAANYPHFDWAKYDNRKNYPRYGYDNSTSKPDSVLDYVVFLYRDGGGTGMGRACFSARRRVVGHLWPPAGHPRARLLPSRLLRITAYLRSANPATYGRNYR